MKNKKQAFTFVELIITSIVLIILSTIGFYSYSKYVGSSKDSERKSNVATLSSGLKNYKQDKGIYPLPSSYFTLTNSGTEVAKQGKIDDFLPLTSLNKIPSDPSLNIPYLYGISENKKEYQIGATLENNGNSIALVDGNYKSVSKNILPSLLIAYDGNSSIDITKAPYKNKFIIDGLAYNLPYNLENGNPFSASGTILSSILIELDERFWQNIDYKSCVEICNAGKSLGDGEYQILSNSGTLVNTICDFKEGGEECETENIIITNYCSVSNPINATLTMGSPNMPNQSRQKINPNNPCYFSCNTNYTWNGIICAPNTRKIMDCIGTLPNNASWVDQKFTQTWNGASWFPSLFSCGQGTTGEGKFDCDTGYSWDGNSCIGSLVSGACTNLPTNSLYSNNTTSYSLSNAPNGTSLDATVAGYYASPTSNTCQYKCDTGYTRSGGACLDTTPPTISNVTASTPACNTIRITVSASDAVALHATAYSFDSGTSWQATNTKDYPGTSYTQAANTVKVRDAAGNIATYASAVSGSASACVSGACTSLPANAWYYNSATSYNLVNAPTGTTLSAVTAGYYASPTSNTCQFKCMTGYNWDGDSCEVDSDYTTKQMFASGNNYTFNWSSTCNPNSMTIVNVSPGTNTLPSSLNSNTIYKLENGNYITSRTIDVGGNCTGIIGGGSTMIYSSNTLSEMISFGGTKLIISGVNIDGRGNGSGGSHTINDEGISSMTNIENITFYKVQFYNNSNAIDLNSSLSNSSFNNVQIYNNLNAITLNGDLENSSLNNVQIYNNLNAITLNGGLDNSSLNNVQIYNNSNAIDINSGLNSLFNNVQIYNNSNVIRANGSISYSLFNNLQIYNNTNSAFDINGGFSNSKYYGTVKIFGNGSNSFGASAGLASQNIPGTSQLASSVGFTDGSISTTGTMACSYHSQPNIASWGTNCSDKGKKLSTSSATSYTYGSNILYQIRPIRYTGTYSITLYGTNGVDYDTSRYIGDF